MSAKGSGPVVLGLGANWKQFTLLVVINAFVGAMVGLERTVVPIIAEEAFGIVSSIAVLTFIATFGAVKALLNLFAGALSDRLGRKNLLVIGWLFGLPVPFLLIAAPAWSWVVAANILLGVNQGLCWSTTVIMKVDLVGPSRRGTAMGLNEFAGYVAVSLSAFGTGYLASIYGPRPEPFFLGIAFAAAGLLLSILFVRDTKAHAQLEAREHVPDRNGSAEASLPFAEVFRRTTWKNRTLFSASQAGLVNNLNDGMMWGLIPIYLSTLGLDVGRIGVVAALYPAVWGVGQLVTGGLSDRIGRKPLIVSGLLVQAVGIAAVGTFTHYPGLLAASAVMGIGTAMVYPTLLAAVSDTAHPQWRASALGVYRLWRDAGYVAGALISGLLADLFGAPTAIGGVALVTALSGGVVALRMREQRRSGAAG